jgi:hypothetical protein
VDGPLPDVSGAFVIDGNVQVQAPASRLLETVNINDIVVS